MKAKAILACLYLLSREEIAQGAFIRQKFIFDDAEEKRMEVAKSESEKQLAQEAEKAKLAQQEAELKQRETEFQQQQAEEEKKKQEQQSMAAQNKTQRSSIAHVPLKNINNQQYTGEIYFGAPPQKLTVQFDTGSAIVYVLTSKCTENCNPFPKYDVEFGKTPEQLKEMKSKLTEALMGRVEYGYGSGYINGFVDETQICFEEGDKAPCIKNMKLLQADQATGVENDRFAGIVGLAPTSTEKNLQGFMKQLNQINQFGQQDSLQAMFSVFLSRTPEENGSITFGGYDLAQYAKAGLSEKDVFWGDVNQNEHYWTLGMSGAGLADSKGQHTDMAGVKAHFAIIDTGVSYAILPTADYQVITKSLGDFGVKCTDPQGEHSSTAIASCECPSFAMLPSIQLFLNFDSRNRENGGKWFDLPPSQYMEQNGAGCGKLRLTPSNEKFGKGDPSEYWIMGDIFLQHYYSIYDYPHSRMGLVEARAIGGGPAPKGQSDNPQQMETLPMPTEDGQ